MKEVTYLGVKFSADERMEGELDRRAGIATSAVGAIQRNIIGSRELKVRKRRWKCTMQWWCQ